MLHYADPVMGKGCLGRIRWGRAEQGPNGTAELAGTEPLK